MLPSSLSINASEPSRIRSHQKQIIVLAILVFLCIGWAINLTQEFGKSNNDNNSHGIDKDEAIPHRVLKCNKPYYNSSVLPLIACENDNRQKSCFRYSENCKNDFKVYVYKPNEPYPDAPQDSEYYEMLTAMRSLGDEYITEDPAKACLFFPNIDTSANFNWDTLRGAKLTELPYWITTTTTTGAQQQQQHQHQQKTFPGLNHIIWEISDSDGDPYDKGYAIRWKTSLDRNKYREGYDYAFPLYPVRPPPFHTRNITREHRWVPPSQRQYLAVFKGQRAKSFARVRDALPALHNEQDGILIATYCCPEKWCEPWHSPYGGCAQEKERANRFDYDSLIKQSKFGLSPRGAGLNTFRLMEIMNAGAIPVILADNFVLPFSEFLDWSEFSVVVPERDVARVPSILKELAQDEQRMARMHARLVEVYERYWTSRQSWLHAVLDKMRSTFGCSQAAV